MESTTMPVISAKNLNLWYGDFKALKNISLDVGEREITALIGPSGCGKSTFLKTLNRMNDLVPGVRIEGDVRSKGRISLPAIWNSPTCAAGWAWCSKRQTPSP